MLRGKARRCSRRERETLPAGAAAVLGSDGRRRDGAPQTVTPRSELTFRCRRDVRRRRRRPGGRTRAGRTVRSGRGSPCARAPLGRVGIVSPAAQRRRLSALRRDDVARLRGHALRRLGSRETRCARPRRAAALDARCRCAQAVRCGRRSPKTAAARAARIVAAASKATHPALHQHRPRTLEMLPCSASIHRRAVGDPGERNDQPGAAHIAEVAAEWPRLIAAVRAALERSVDPAEELRPLVQRWKGWYASHWPTRSRRRRRRVTRRAFGATVHGLDEGIRSTWRGRSRRRRRSLVGVSDTFPAAAVVRNRPVRERPRAQQVVHAGVGAVARVVDRPPRPNAGEHRSRITDRHPVALEDLGEETIGPPRVLSAEVDAELCVQSAPTTGIDLRQRGNQYGDYARTLPYDALDEAPDDAIGGGRRGGKLGRQIGSVERQLGAPFAPRPAPRA